MRRSVPTIVTLSLVCAMAAVALADPSRYAVTAKNGPRAEGAPTEYQADNPANQLRLAFPVTGMIGSPELAGTSAWSFDFRLANISFEGRPAPVGSARLSSAGNRVDYDFESSRVSYFNVPLGLEQLITIAEPDIRGKAGAPAVISLELTVDGDLEPVQNGYFVNLIDPNGDVALRYGPVEANDADGRRLDAQLDLATNEEGAITGARVTINAIDPAYPIEVRATVASAAARKTPPGAPAAEAAQPEIVGVPVTLEAGIVETVDKIMERERLSPPEVWAVPRETHHEMDLDEELKEDPNAPPPMSHWPPIPEMLSSSAVPGVPNLPQTVGTSFKGVGLSESGYIPPDTMGDVGPTQILMHVNGRIKVFSKAGALGGLNASEATFWASLSPTGGVSDPQVRYDRLSGRWFVLAIDLASTNNKILLAVSSGPTITNQASFTFYQFSIGTPAPADASCFCDYPGFGIDANALYTGCNMFRCSFHTSAFVIRKSSVLSGGPIVVTGFPNIGSSGSAGPYAPRGVDNDDPNFASGYIIGTDPGFLNRINLRKVSNPGTTPTLGPTITLAVSDTNILNQSALGSTIDINTSDTRLYAASIHKNKITGVLSMWTAHVVETDTTCTPAGSGNNRRLGAKWYEIGNLSTTPTITQFGTLCTTATGSTTSNTERGFFYPTVVQTGQGHMALGASYASATEFVGIAAAGRLRTDPVAGTRAPETIVLAGSASYTNSDGSRNRWGDYSHTDIDPTDDQTVWTFQEYADTPQNNWSVRAVQLKAPPPPTAATAGSPVCNGVAAAPVNITGIDSCVAPTCTNGLCTGGGPCPEFFDPGPDTGGPGYAKHLTASVTGGVTVNSANIVIPANPATQRVLSVALSLNTTASTPGPKTLTIINPDGQGKAYNSIINVIANRLPVANAGGPYTVCLGDSATLDGTGSSDPDSACGDSIVSYDWDLNGDTVIDVTGATPTVTPAQLSALGLGVGPHTISLKVTDSNGAGNTTSGTLTLLANGSGCSDGNACTETDTCQAGVCVGANPVTCTASDPCHVAGVCDTGTGACSNPNADDGTTCNDANACTQTDACQSGVCTGANPVVCTPIDPCHVAGVCNTVTGICPNPAAPDGTTCDDQNATTCGDICTSAVCAGQPVPAPAAIDNSLRVEKTPSDATITWADAPGPYGVYRGSNGPGGTPWSYDQTCLAPGVVVPEVADPDIPAPGVFFYYLITRFDQCRESIPGVDSSQNPIPNALPCPVP